jgi:hypothetical protein
VIDPKDWIWMGHPAHFICADDCRFRLATKIGRFIVSTVGQMYYSEATAKALGRDPTMPVKIGCDRLFETMVFPASDVAEECGCFRPSDLGEIDYAPANDAKTATANHMALCFKYANEVPK